MKGRISRNNLMRCGILLLRRQTVPFIAVIEFIVLAVIAFAHSKDDNLNDILKKMEEVKKGIYALKVYYTQSIFFESTKEKQEVSGTLLLRKPDSIYIN